MHQNDVSKNIGPDTASGLILARITGYNNLNFNQIFSNTI